MEKIYMENNNKKKKSKLNGSVIISFSVALVAIISLTVFGFNQISYAADENGEVVFADSFTTKDIPDSNNTQAIIGETSRIEGLSINQYFSASGEVLYCLEADKAFPDNQTVNRNEEIYDSGLLYLMSNMYPNKKLSYNGTEGDAKVQTWLTQTAIWIYLSDNGFEKNILITNAVKEAFKKEHALYDSTFTQTNSYLVNLNGASLYDSFVNSDGLNINQLLARANELVYNQTTTLALSPKNSKIALTKDEKYYESEAISVVGSVTDKSLGEFRSYGLSINKAPKGTIIVDKDGKKIDNLDNLSPTQQFKVWVPVNNLTNDNKKVEIYAYGIFDIYTAYRYSIGDEGQDITHAKKTTNLDFAELPIEFNYSPVVPDTGMGTAQSIYFIGLIVLLSGVGIIYATVKPAKSN